MKYDQKKPHRLQMKHQMPWIFLKTLLPIQQRIAQIRKQAVLASDRTQRTKFQSAISMLNYYINRAGKNLKTEDRARLEQAKISLRKLFGKI